MCYVWSERSIYRAITECTTSFVAKQYRYKNRVGAARICEANDRDLIFFVHRKESRAAVTTYKKTSINERNKERHQLQ